MTWLDARRQILIDGGEDVLLRRPGFSDAIVGEQPDVIFREARRRDQQILDRTGVGAWEFQVLNRARIIADADHQGPLIGIRPGLGLWLGLWLGLLGRSRVLRRRPVIE